MVDGPRYLQGKHGRLQKKVWSNTGLLWVLMFSFEIAIGVWLLTTRGPRPTGGDEQP